MVAFQSFTDFMETYEDKHHSSRLVDGAGLREFDLLISPILLVFDPLEVGEISAPKTITLTNKGWKALPIVGITYTGEFNVTHSVPASLAPGASSTITVSFEPEEEGIRDGQISIDTGTALGVRTVTLKGGIDASGWDHRAAIDRMLNGLWGFIQRSVKPALNGEGPLISMSNTSVAFPGETLVGQESGTINFTISNAGNQPLILDDLLVTGDFEIVP